MWISPNHQETDFNSLLSIDDKITIFVDRTLGWQLDIANICINGKKDNYGNIVIEAIPHSGYAVLSIVFSYFEMIGKFINGYDKNGSSQTHFVKGIYLVFPELENFPKDSVNDFLEALYEGARCGLYHGGLPDSRIVLFGQSNCPIFYHNGCKKIIINPHLLIPKLVEHLKKYESDLRNPENEILRSNFENRFDFLNKPFD